MLLLQGESDQLGSPVFRCAPTLLGCPTLSLSLTPALTPSLTHSLTSLPPSHQLNSHPLTYVVALAMQLLNILFCTLMFSGGLPILLPCVSIIFAVTYWAEKWELLKLSRVPSPYAGDLAALTGKPSPPHLTCMSCGYLQIQSCMATLCCI